MDYIGISMGDPAGIGCEIILKALRDEEIRKRTIIFGSGQIISHFLELLNMEEKVKSISDLGDFDSRYINYLDVLPIKLNDFKLGQVSALCGNAAYSYVEQAINWAMAGKIKGVVTAPLNKESLQLAGHDYEGHTEIFADLTDTDKYAMLLWSDKLKVIHVSTHLALRNACDMVKEDRVLDTIILANNSLKRMGIKRPKIAVAGLNPHASESGIFGDEEASQIEPAVRLARDLDIDAEGPLAPDTVFLKAYQRDYDIVVAMYHDQGHIPMKLIAFDSGVNITVGLPIIRTSVDHGTAFGKAGKGIANEKSMINAIKIAAAYNL